MLGLLVMDTGNPFFAVLAQGTEAPPRTSSSSLARFTVWTLAALPVPLCVDSWRGTAVGQAGCRGRGRRHSTPSTPGASETSNPASANSSDSRAAATSPSSATSRTWPTPRATTVQVRPPNRTWHPGSTTGLPGSIYVLRKGVAWRDVPVQVVGCSGITSLRRLRDWTKAAVWPAQHQALLTELRAADALDMDDCAVDGSHGRALRGGDHVGPSLVDRRRPGSKHHVIVDRQGTPLAVSLTGGNRHDVTQLIPLLDAIPRIGGLRGRPRNRPKRMFADRGYDFDKYRRLLWKRGIKPLIARRGVDHGSGLGKTRWVVERTFAWLYQFKRLRIRYERRADLHHGLLQLACCLICLRRLQASS